MFDLFYIYKIHRRQTITLEKPVKFAPELSIDKKNFITATSNLLDPKPNDLGDALNIPGYRFSVGQLPSWAKKQVNISFQIYFLFWHQGHLGWHALQGKAHLNSKNEKNETFLFNTR